MKAPDGSADWQPPIYVYAIVPTPSAVGEQFAAAPPAGRLGTISAGPFAAVVGDGVRPGGPGQTREQLAPQLLAHQRTIEQIMRAGPLLPVKFGTFAAGEGDVRVILERGEAAFGAAFDRLGGGIQMELLVKWDLRSVLAELSGAEAIVTLKRRLEREGAAGDPAARAEFGKLVKDAVEERRATLAASLLEQLTPMAEDVIVYPSTADQVVLHLVLLMKMADVEAFYRSLEALDAAHGGRLTFRCIGPSAPYSFATVEIQLGDPAASARARQLLAVEQGASAADVRAAYRRLAKSLHPDLAGAGADDGARMAELTAAYHVLTAEAEAGGEGTGRAAGSCTAGSHPGGAAVHVFVRRHESAFDGAR